VKRGWAGRPNESDWRHILCQEFLFFLPVTGLGPPLGPSRRRSSSPDLSWGKPVRPRRPFDECSSRRKKAPAGKGPGRRFRGTLSGTMSRKSDTNANRAANRAHFLEHCRVSSDASGDKVLFPRRFLRQCRFSAAILATVSCLRHYKSGHVGLETRFRCDFVSEWKNVRRPEPRPDGPSSVETPIFGRIRWTPCASVRAGPRAGRGGWNGLQETT